MPIIQIDSTGAVLILGEQIIYLLTDVVGIGSNFFFFCREVPNLMLLVLDHDERLVCLLYLQLSIVCITFLERIFQTSFSTEIF